MIEIYVDDAPLELRRIIDKALAKNAADRYLTIEELAEDLKRFHRRLEFEAELGRSNDDTRPNTRPTTRSEEVTRALPVVSDEQLTQLRPQARQKRHLLVPGVIIALALSTVIGLLVWQSGKSDTAVVPEPPVVPVPAAPVQMVAYSLTVQGFTDGRYKEPFKLSGEMLFRNKDRIRLHIVSPNAGYLYILNQGPRGENDEPAYNILFPSPTANDGSAAIPAGREIQVPGQSWFELDEKEGTEFVWLVWSANAVPELESAKRFANPQDRGRIKDTELSRTIGTILQKYQTNSSDIERDDDKKQSVVKGNTDIVAHNIKLEHH